MKGANKILSQRYEEYWSLTLEYSDIYGEQFNFTLNYIVNYIDIGVIRTTIRNYTVA